MSWKGYAFILFMIVPIQTTLTNYVSVQGIKPDLGFIAACLIGFRKGEMDGLVMGFLIGMLMDLFSGGVEGINMLSKSLAGWISGHAGKTFLDIKLVSALGIVTGLSVLLGLLIYLFLQFSRGNMEFLQTFREIIFPQAIYNGILGAVLLKMLPRREPARIH